LGRPSWSIAQLYGAKYAEYALTAAALEPTFDQLNPTFDQLNSTGIYALEYLNLTLEYRPKNGCAGVSTKLL
jgi:hypothetical protein